MRIALAIVLALHGIAHGVGFAVPWRLGEFEEIAYETTLLSGRIDVGPVGIRAVGILWLLTGIAFVVAAVGLWTRQAWWPVLTTGVAAFSLLLSVLGWPDSRIGVAVNVAILVGLVLGVRFGWLTAGS